MNRWPPIIWLLISIGNLFVLMGAGGDWNPEAFFLGLATLVLGFGAAMYFAYGDRRRRHRARGLHWLVALVAAFYAACLTQACGRQAVCRRAAASYSERSDYA
jgi:peptidoglycan/LPS O-acetylase OafA/YrhL